MGRSTCSIPQTTVCHLLLRASGFRSAHVVTIITIAFWFPLPYKPTGTFAFWLKYHTHLRSFATNAMVRHGREPYRGAVSMSASMNFAASGLKSADVGADMHVHAPVQSASFPTHQDGETKSIWAFPWPAARCGIGRSHWSAVQMSEMRAKWWWWYRHFSTPQHEMRWCAIASCMKHHVKGPKQDRSLEAPLKKNPETSANPSIWGYSGGLPKFRQFLICCFQAAVLFWALDVKTRQQDRRLEAP